MVTSVWHVHIASVSFIPPSHPVSKRMINFLRIYFVVYPYGCYTLSSRHKHRYTSITWELRVYETLWDEKSVERRPALSLSITNGNIWATPQLNLFWRLKRFKWLPLLCHMILFVLFFLSRKGKCQNTAEDLVVASFLSDWIQGSVLRNLMDNSSSHPQSSSICRPTQFMSSVKLNHSDNWEYDKICKRAFQKLTSNSECSGRDTLKELGLRKALKIAFKKMKLLKSSLLHIQTPWSSDSLVTSENLGRVHL